ncbi:MAG: hypothetical protein AMXMBFR53_10560 [Gemmatimonadota bacterium]
MTFPIPDWALAEPGVAPALSAPVGAGGRVIVLVAGEGAVEAGWVGEVTVDLARAWSDAGARLVLADGGLTRPLLHETLGIPLGEGLVDALRWGASVKRVATRPAGHSFFVITAGTAVADAVPVVQGPRWPALCAGFREAGVTLAVLVPEGESSREGILGQATEVLVLAGPDEDAGTLLAGWEGPVLGVLGRDAPPPPAAPEVARPDEAAPVEAPPADPAPPEPGPDQPRLWEPEAMEAEPDGPPEAAPSRLVSTEDLSPWGFEEPAGGDDSPEDFAGDSAEADDTDEEPAPEPFHTPDEDPRPTAVHEPVPTFEEIVDEVGDEPVPTFEEIVEEAGSEPNVARGSGRSRILLLVLLVVVLGAVAAALLGYVRIPGIAPLRGGAVEPGDAVSVPGPTIAAGPPSEAGDPQPYSLALGAFQDEAAARSLAETLAAQVQGVLFVTAPVAVDGVVLHRVLAGPAADSATAAALSAVVAGSGGLDASAWAPRATPKAFQLGEMPELEAARRRAEVLQGLGIPAYVLAVPFSDGSLRFRVYAGAYADAAEASYLSGLLEERGLNSASLSDRIGRLPE